MMNRVKILIDLDGVIVDLLSRWCAVYNATYDDNLTIEEFAKEWNVHKHVKCGELVYELYEQEGFFEDLEFMPGAVEGLKQLSLLEYEGKVELYIVSDFSGNPTIAIGKMRWIKKYLPWFDEDRVILTAAKHMISGNILIDDSVKKLGKWHEEQEGVSILMAAPHNRNALFTVDCPFIQCKDWDAVIATIKFELLLWNG